MEPKVVEFPNSRKPPGKTDEQRIKEIKAALRKLCNLIDNATKAGLKVELCFDAQDTYGGGLVRSREPRITREYR